MLGTMLCIVQCFELLSDVIPVIALYLAPGFAKIFINTVLSCFDRTGPSSLV